MSDTPAEQCNAINRAFADTIAAKDAEIRRLESKLAAMEKAMSLLGRECERNRYFREIEGKYPQVCGEVYREWSHAKLACDANPIASAAIAGAGDAT